LSVLALFSQAAQTKEVEGDKCYGLAIASGKNYGPYQAGAIKAMLENPNEGKWDAISGVTEGALNAYILSLFAPDE
jgi:predicted acylesterase/phospholipase RssA